MFAGIVFVAGMALWLAARPQPQVQVPQAARAATRSAAGQTRAPASFIAGEEEPVRQGINLDS